MSDDLSCLFCGNPAGEEPIFDEAGEVACRSCGEAEIAAQQKEGFMVRQDPIEKRMDDAMTALNVLSIDAEKAGRDQIRYAANRAWTELFEVRKSVAATRSWPNTDLATSARPG